MNEEISRRLQTAIASLEVTRDGLFDCSRECVTDGGENSWQVAEELFALAKSADAIRYHIMSCVEGKQVGIRSNNVVVRSTIAGLSKPARKNKDNYPTFALRNNALVKTGLSRDRRTDYEHMVPKRNYDKVISHLVTMSDRVEEFTTDDVQSLMDFPLYQTYTVLSLLKNVKLLNLPRRGLYSFDSNKTFKFEIGEVWANLKKA